MGMTVRIPGSSFTNVLTSLSIPNRTGLVAEYVFGESFAASQRNLADAANPLTLNGAPTYTANSAIIRSGVGGYGFLTGLTPLPARTEILIRKINTGYADAIWVGQSGFGFGDRVGASTIFRDGENNNTYGAQRPIPAAGTTFFEAAVGSGSVGGFGKLFAYPAGVQAEWTSANAKVIIAQTAVQIGGSGLAGNTTLGEVLYYARFHRKLTSAEIHEVYLSLKTFMAERGAVI